MDGRTAIGYVVYCPARDTFRGKLGSWYTDVRLATVYAEPRAARMAIMRAEHDWTCVVVPVTMAVRGIDMDTAVQDSVAIDRDREAGQPIIPTAKAEPPTKAAKARVA